MNFENSTSTELAEQTAAIVAAYVSNNHIAFTELPAIIASVHVTLAQIATRPVETVTAEKLVPAVAIKKSVTEEFIVCLEDGKQFKSLKRHLSTKFNMTPDEYRARWNLPSDYPMVAPGYSAKRSALALSLGLGRKAAVSAEPEAVAAPAVVEKAKRGRKPKATVTA